MGTSAKERSIPRAARGVWRFVGNLVDRRIQAFLPFATSSVPRRILMSFWSEASPISKGLIVFGVLGLIYLGVAKMVGLPPWVSAPEGYDGASSQRGIEPR